MSLRANGAGCSRWGATGITRWRDDALRDAYGSFFYLRWRPASRSRCRSPSTRRPTRPRTTRARFHADRVCFDAAWPELQAHTTVWVSPEDDIEFRQVELRNLGDRTLDIELISAFEVTLADAARRRGAPGVHATCSCAPSGRPAHQALVFERKPRLATERGLHAAHFLADSDPQVVGVRVQTDRAALAGPQPRRQPAAGRRSTPLPATRRRVAGRAGHRPGPGVRAGRAPAHRARAARRG